MFVKNSLAGRIFPTGVSLLGWHGKVAFRQRIGAALATAAAGASTPTLTTMATTPATLFISNKFREAREGATFEVLNPATETVLSVCANGGEEDVDEAVKAARACFEGPSWGMSSTGVQRGGCLRALASAIEDDKEAFALAETQDTGKPIEDSEGEIDEAIDYLRYYAGLAEGLDEESPEQLKTPDYNQNFRTRVVREPIGVVGAITPWNYPLCTAVNKVAAALAAGCTVVLKPSELAPSTCLRMAGLAEAAGFPPGALNVVTGEGFPTGDALSRHPGLDKVSFTGSVPTGQRVMAAAAKAGPTDVHLELGGKSAMIVFDDVEEVEAAVDWACVGIFSNSGQVCSATSRLLVQSKIYDQVVSSVVDRASRISVGDPMRRGRDAPGPCMGPLVSGPQKERVLGFVTRAVEGGATVISGDGADRNAAVQKPAVGYYVSPTILSEVSDENEAWDAEIFGPVLCVRRFEEESEAIESANRSEFGLAASVMSSDQERCKRVSRALRAGVVWENCSQCAPVEAPWGGFKKSGVGGRELGRWGLDEFLGVKAITSCKQTFSYNSYGGASPST
ncbi:Aldehyde dehydrogenase [Ectocarpus siliculosus]|uniref:Aldehyde dehydrogenase n=1 Tax=Ectocarpus siliculosus TaxID=2880 RepID=D7G1L8_ECTSI|nr:Aldehyde dehydrogenase [Ectocarpus siliculosus]|eukprot:CBJ33263.1 Aldehyde dehydrogenase [Ectocarpus siliculosus]